MSLTVLRRFPVLAELSDSELEDLESFCTPEEFEHGQYLFSEGEPGDAAFFILDGMVVVDRLIDAAAGTRKDLALLPALTFVGDMILAGDSPRSASVRAELPVRALRLTRSEFDRIVDQHPSVAIKLFRALFLESSQRLRNTNEELIAVYEVGRLVAGATDASVTAEGIVRSLVRRLRASYGLIAFYDAGPNGLRIAYTTGAKSDQLLGELIPLDRGLVAQCFDQKKPLLVETLLGATDPWESASLIVTPLLVRDRAVGVLLLGVAESGTPYHVSQLSLVAAVSNISAPLLNDGLR